MSFGLDSLNLAQIFIEDLSITLFNIDTPILVSENEEEKIK